MALRKLSTFVLVTLAVLSIWVTAAAEAAPACLGKADTNTATRSYNSATQTWTITGTPGDDVILGTPGRDIIRGRAGRDIICGLEGNDTLVGSWGPDSLVGGPGDDVLDGGNGNDTVYAGPGNDHVLAGRHADTVQGGPGHDLLDLGAGPDTALGGAGHDTILGRYSRDNINGGPGVDNINGGPSNDTIDGGSANDIITGNTGIDTCNNRERSDRIVNCERGTLAVPDEINPMVCVADSSHCFVQAGTSGKVVLVVGDSHSTEAAPIFEAWATAHGHELWRFPIGSCSWVRGLTNSKTPEFSRERCINGSFIHRHNLIEAIQPDIIIVHARAYENHPKRLTVNQNFIEITTPVATMATDSLDFYASKAEQVIHIESIPVSEDFSPADCVEAGRSDCDFVPVEYEANVAARAYAASHAGVDNISWTDQICQPDLCPAVLDGVLVRKDTNHLSTAMVQRILPGAVNLLSSVSDPDSARGYWSDLPTTTAPTTTAPTTTAPTTTAPTTTAPTTTAPTTSTTTLLGNADFTLAQIVDGTIGTGDGSNPYEEAPMGRHEASLYLPQGWNWAQGPTRNSVWGRLGTGGSRFAEFRCAVIPEYGHKPTVPFRINVRNGAYYQFANNTWSKAFDVDLTGGNHGGYLGQAGRLNTDPFSSGSHGLIPWRLEADGSYSAPWNPNALMMHFWAGQRQPPTANQTAEFLTSEIRLQQPDGQIVDLEQVNVLFQCGIDYYNNTGGQGTKVPGPGIAKYHRASTDWRPGLWVTLPGDAPAASTGDFMAWLTANPPPLQF